MADDGRILVLLAAAGLAAAGAVRQRARLSSPDSLLSSLRAGSGSTEGHKIPVFALHLPFLDDDLGSQKLKNRLYRAKLVRPRFDLEKDALVAVTEQDWKRLRVAEGIRKKIGERDRLLDQLDAATPKNQASRQKTRKIRASSAEQLRQVDTLLASLRSEIVQRGRGSRGVVRSRCTQKQKTPHVWTDKALPAYIEAALWSSTGEDEEPLDGKYGPSDLAPETRETMRADVESFLERCDEEEIELLDWTNAEQVGHDLWLTRNGHGTGFWDRGNEPVWQKLSDLAHELGSADLYVGDDGQIYQS